MDGMLVVVIALFVGAIIFRVLTNSIVKNAKDKPVSKPIDKLVVKTKQCPPHQWFYQDIVDEAGTYQGARLVCKLCGPINTGGGSRES